MTFPDALILLKALSSNVPDRRTEVNHPEKELKNCWKAGL
jgi:hypothetical protein